MGYLVIYQTQFQTLSFMSGLERIGGASTFGTSVIFIRQNNGMTSLGLNSLKSINGPVGATVTVRSSSTR